MNNTTIVVFKEEQELANLKNKLDLMMGDQQAWKYLNLNEIKMKCMSCYKRKASRDKKTGFTSLNCFQDVMDAGDWSILNRMYRRACIKPCVNIKNLHKDMQILYACIKVLCKSWIGRPGVYDRNNQPFCTKRVHKGVYAPQKIEIIRASSQSNRKKEALLGRG